MKWTITAAIAVLVMAFTVLAQDSHPENAATNVKISFSLGDDKRMSATTLSDGQVVSFNGIVTRLKQNGRIVEARIGNMDDQMKTSYGIVLDEKGTGLANVKGSVHVTGRVRVENGKNMLVVEDFSSGAARQAPSQVASSPKAKQEPRPQPAPRGESLKTTRQSTAAATTSRKSAVRNKWMEAAELDGADFAGDWRLTSPAGFVRTAVVSRVSQTQYRIQKTGNLNGTYELRENALVIVTPADPRLTEFTWMFKNTDSLVLVKSSLAAGADYTGSILDRIK